MSKLRGFSNAVLTFNLNHLERLKNFLDEVQFLWDKRLNDYEIIGSEIEDEEEREKYFDFFYDEWSEYRDEYPRIAKYSLIVSCHSYFEKICSDYYRSVLRDNLDLEVIPKRNIYALDYLKWFNDNYGERTIETKKIEELQLRNDVRNRIVHSNGKVDKKENKRLLRTIYESQWLDLNNHDELVIKDEYINETIDLLSSLIIEVHNCVYGRE